MKRICLVVTIVLISLITTVSNVSAQEQIGFTIKSVDVMKQTQDSVCNPPSDGFISSQIKFAKELGATHVAISTPYDDPECGSSISLTERYVSAIRLNGLNVWFRQKPLAFEGFYNTPKTTDYNLILDIIGNYILSHRELYMPGDIISPVPEPQNGGIRGVNCFDDNCLFEKADVFNDWLVLAITETTHALENIGLKDQIKVGYFGFDGFIAWGDRNPNWDGILDPETITASGSAIAIDHYFPADADPMDEFRKIRTIFGNDAEICLSEWGSINNEPTERIETVLLAALRNDMSCINWWHLGPGGTGEQLLDLTIAEDGSEVLIPNEKYFVVQKLFSL